MDDHPALVCNTGPLIAIAAACGDWSPFAAIGRHILVPRTVREELQRGRPGTPGRDLGLVYPWMELCEEPAVTPAFLRNSLDPGESAVIATALERGIPTVAIDEKAGRRTARACNLVVTGTWSILRQAGSRGYPIDLAMAIDRVRGAGIWVSEALARSILATGPDADLTRS
jgi:predicted nucleic acid-binding protein